VDQGHGRIEWRGIETRAVTPAQMGFPHAAQIARIDRIRELKNGRQEVETIWIITSLTAARADAARLLELARQYWSIENGTHYPLDVSAGEDRCRVRHPVAATVLGLLRRAAQGEARAWIRRQSRARDRTCPTFFAKMSRRLGDVIRLITCPA
jgi:predicted transposase YbfD/YdcC